MKFSRFGAFILFLTAASSIAGGLIVSAQRTSQDSARKLAPWVIEQTAAGQAAEFLVMMKDQADLGAAALLLAKEEKTRYVFEALRAKASASQFSLLEFLKQRGAEHKPFYIINAVWVRGTRDLANEIAARADVARIVGNPQLPGIQPIEPGESETANIATTDPAVVEPGVSYIRAPEVWSMGFTGQGVVIGGEDTGVQWDHPALQKQYRGWDGTNANHDFNWHDSIHANSGQANGGVCGPDAKAPCDDHNHGTHTLGTTLGTDGGANQIGVAPGAKFIACRNMDQGNGTPASYLECFEFFLAPYPVGGTPAQGNPSKAPDITVNSWGCPPSEGCEPDTLRGAVEAHRAAGIMTVVSAGNEGFRGCGSVIDPPSFYAASYSVGAIDAGTGLIAGFSSRGPVLPVLVDGSNRIKPDITAPGVGVRSSIRGGNYTRLNGTSMAGPHVAGATALLWSAYPWLRGQIALTERLLNESATRVDAAECGSAVASAFPNAVYGYGWLNIKSAVDLVATLVNSTAADLNATSVSPAEAQVIARGGVVRAEVATLPHVSWRAVSRDAWITVVLASSITGSGGINILVAENPSAQVRRGSVMIAGRVVTITQAGAPYAVSGRVANTDGAGLGRVTITFSRVSGSGEIPAAVQTDDAGNWRQAGFEPGTNYRVTPSSRRQSFSPASRDFNTASAAFNFVNVGRGIIITR